MHRLPANADLSFFSGKTLFQVCVGANEMIFHFDEGVSVTVTSCVGVIGGTKNKDLYEDFRAAAPAIVQLIEDTVASASGSGGTLSLKFRSGRMIEFYDSDDHYESYQIKNGDQLIVV